jgi:putative hydrolase of the HAD superfamily
MRAVVFDLFHTLVDTEHLRPTGFSALAQISSLTGLDQPALAEFWAGTYLERETTTIDLVDLVERYCRSVGVAVIAAQRREIDALFGVCKDDALRFPHPDMVSLVAELSRRVSIGVLSNCHAREVRCWPESPFAPYVTAIGRSCEIGTMKPDPVAYQWVLEAVGVTAGNSVYVGNGSSDELGGAIRVGFASVIHCNIFDRTNGLVPLEEQRRRAEQAGSSVGTIAELSAALAQRLEPLQAEE